MPLSAVYLPCYSDRLCVQDAGIAPTDPHIPMVIQWMAVITQPGSHLASPFGLSALKHLKLIPPKQDPCAHRIAGSIKELFLVFFIRCSLKLRLCINCRLFICRGNPATATPWCQPPLLQLGPWSPRRSTDRPMRVDQGWSASEVSVASQYTGASLKSRSSDPGPFDVLLRWLSPRSACVIWSIRLHSGRIATIPAGGRDEPRPALCHLD